MKFVFGLQLSGVHYITCEDFVCGAFIVENCYRK
jgi:hypothetical protein